jgi:translation initiation factor 1 (eIF-1/SUI1)
MSLSAATPFRAAPVDIENSDVVSEAKAQLKKLAAALKASTSADAATQNHYVDLQDRIKKALDPK